MKEDIFSTSKAFVSVSDADYINMRPITEHIIALERVVYQSFYIVDFFKKNFYYVSENFAHICGLTPDEIYKQGFSFYKNRIPEDDCNMMYDIIARASSFCDTLIREGKDSFTIFCDFHLSDGAHTKLVSHQVTPLAIKEGRPWLALCSVSMSHNHVSGNLAVKTEKDFMIYKCTNNTREWECIKIPRLNNIEKNVLRMIAQGLSTECIALRLNKSLDTIKSCKKLLFKKLCVRSSSQAITFVQNYRLI